MGFSIQESAFEIVHFEVGDSTPEAFKDLEKIPVLEFSKRNRLQNLAARHLNFMAQKR